MKLAKQQWNEHCHQKPKPFTNIFSAFRPYKQQEEQNNAVDMSFDIETYINKRKFENSFTLSDITDSSLTVKKDIIKNQSLYQTQQISKLEPQWVKTQPVKSLSIVRQIQYSYVPKTKAFPLRKFSSKVLSLKLYPIKKQFKDSMIQVEIEKQHNKNQENLLSSEQSEDQRSIGKFKMNERKKTKKQQKRSKIAEKKTKNQRNKNQKLIESDTNKNQKNPKNKNKKDIQQTSSSNEEITNNFPFDGVLRNCECCGKLISKLCFKCPHLYCKAQDCRRKRKKILNEKMLQKMKEQKIREHYRQRELYEKMKLQKGGNFNAKLVQKNEKVELKNEDKNERENQKRKVKRMNKKYIESSSGSNEWKTQQSQFNSQIFYDSQQETQKQKSKKKDKQKMNFQKQTQMNIKKYQRDSDGKRIIQQGLNSNKLKNQNLFNHKNQIQHAKIDPFEMSFLISQDQTNQNLMDKIKQEKQQKLLNDRRNQNQKIISIKSPNKIIKKNQKIEIFDDEDFESTF